MLLGRHKLDVYARHVLQTVPTPLISLLSAGRTVSGPVQCAGMSNCNPPCHLLWLELGVPVAEAEDPGQHGYGAEATGLFCFDQLVRSQH